MAVLLASGTAEASSGTFVLADGATATLCLFDADGGSAPNQAVAYIQRQSSAGTYMNIGRLTADEPIKVVAGAGTYRVFRPLAPVAFGVDKD